VSAQYGGGLAAGAEGPPQLERGSGGLSRMRTRWVAGRVESDPMFAIVLSVRNGSRGAGRGGGRTGSGATRPESSSAFRAAGIAEASTCPGRAQARGLSAMHSLINPKP